MRTIQVAVEAQAGAIDRDIRRDIHRAAPALRTGTGDGCAQRGRTGDVNCATDGDGAIQRRGVTQRQVAADAQRIAGHGGASDTQVTAGADRASRRHRTGHGQAAADRQRADLHVRCDQVQVAGIAGQRAAHRQRAIGFQRAALVAVQCGRHRAAGADRGAAAGQRDLTRNQVAGIRQGDRPQEITLLRDNGQSLARRQRRPGNLRHTAIIVGQRDRAIAAELSEGQIASGIRDRRTDGSHDIARAGGLAEAAIDSQLPRAGQGTARLPQLANFHRAHGRQATAGLRQRQVRRLQRSQADRARRGVKAHRQLRSIIGHDHVGHVRAIRQHAAGPVAGIHPAGGRAIAGPGGGRGLVDTGGHGGAIDCQRIVGRIGACQRQTTDGHGLVIADMAVAEVGGASHADLVTRKAVVGAGHLSDLRAVIDLRHTGKARRQRTRGDVRGRAARSRHHIVARIRARQDHIRYRHRLAGGGVLVAEGGGTRNRDDVAGHAVIRGGHGGDRVAVIDLVDATVGHDQRARRDVRAGAACRNHRVVAGIGTGQAHAGHADGLVVGHVLVAIGGGAHDGQHIAGHAVIRGGHGRDGAAVIHFVHTAVGHVQHARADVGGGAAGRSHRIVARIGARQRDPGHVHGLAIGDVLVREGSAARNAQHIAGHAVVGRGHRSERAAVIHLVDATIGDRQRAWRDVAGGIAGRSHRVVARIGARQRHAGHAHGLAIGDILVREGSRARNCQRIAGHAVIASADSGDGAAVIHLGVAAVGHDQCARRDVGGGRAGRGHRVVVRIRARQRHTGHTDRLATANVLVAEGGGTRNVQHIAGHAIITGGHCRDGTAVIHLVHAGIADHERALCDVSRGAAGRGHGIVARIGARQRHAGHAHCLTVGDILVAECSGTRDRDRVAGHTVIGGGHAGRGCTVIHLVDAAVGDGQRARSDLTIAADGAVAGAQGIVGRIIDRAAVDGDAAQGQTGQRIGLVGLRARILVREIASTRHAHLVIGTRGRGHQANRGQRQVAHHGIAVINLADAARADGHALLVDLDRTDHIDRGAEVRASIEHAGGAHLVGACLQAAGAAEPAIHRTQIELRLRRGAIGDRHRAAGHADIACGQQVCHRQRISGIRVIGHVAGRRDRVSRRVAIGGGLVLHLHQQFADRHDGERARQIGDRIVGCRQARRHQRVGVGARRILRRRAGQAAAVTRDCQRASQHTGRGLGLATDEAAVAHAIEAGRVGLGVELRVVIRGNGQRCFVDGAAAIAPDQAVVARARARQRDRALLHRAIACVCAVIHRRADQAQAIADRHVAGQHRGVCATQRAIADHASRHRRGRVIHLVHAGAARQAYVQRRDVGRGRHLARDRVVVDVGTAVGAGNGHRLAVGDVFIAKGACGRDCQRIARDQAGARDGIGVHGRDIAAVIGLVGGGDARNRQRLRRDICATVGLTGNRVVIDISAGITAAQGHDLAIADVLVREHTSSRYVHHVIRNQATEQYIRGRHRGRAGAVIDTAVGHQPADDQ